MNILGIEQNPDYQASFAPAYRELFDGINPSQQLLNATRRLYKPKTGCKPAFWPAAASLCAACLLLTIGWQLWPQPAENPLPQDVQMRSARQMPGPQDALENTLENSLESAPESTPQARQAALESGMAESLSLAAPEQSQLFMADSQEKDQESICALPPNSDSGTGDIPARPQLFLNLLVKMLKWLALW